LLVVPRSHSIGSASWKYGLNDKHRAEILDIPVALSPERRTGRGLLQVGIRATEVFRLDAPDGGVVARLSVDGAEFWLGDESPEHSNFSPESLGGGSVRMVLTVADPDAVFSRARAAGGQEIHPVGEQHGWRVGRVVDPFGHHWEARPLP
jgi:PhnB protein